MSFFWDSRAAERVLFDVSKGAGEEVVQPAVFGFSFLEFFERLPDFVVRKLDFGREDHFSFLQLKSGRFMYFWTSLGFHIHTMAPSLSTKIFPEYSK